ncbi:MULTISPECIES: CocE/NonD family hydrolase [unclassified Nocardioides]|uniref:CocE/NonD family hydrolase n=1 Tax=unclassified Nocardioides TaxID=2615069 RepID=UPI0000570187|nr:MULTISPECIES: CocE/NonD family hydrolase [unclassified Nocardioides]ABL81617.1 peptidase S15 [Nocardioides sp. JS614]
MHAPARPSRFAAVLAAAFSLVVAGLVATGSGAQAAEDTFTVAGSARQVYAVGLPAGSQATLVDGAGDEVRTQAVNELGGVLFRHVRPGSGYVVRAASGTASDPLTVHGNSAKQWNESIYDQTIPSDGYGYLTTRDGTKLAYSVHPPTDLGGVAGGGTLPDLPTDAPFPTLIEYSGYGYANPAGPDSGIAAVANAMGFAVVDIQMRGTGCSGGAFDFFEPLQSIDGYDIVETVARQPWVQGGKVGMVGISYGGISQLFTAQTRPPHLAAISPLSVIDATATTLYPGGILNTGFAVAWAKERQQQAQPAGTGAEGTQAYAEQRITDGDQTCQDNQVLHPEAADLMTKIKQNSHYRPRVADPLDPVSFVHKITVPTFMACQFQDEQTGGHCPALVRNFTGTDKLWFTFTNGAHIDSLDPETLNRLYDFLMLYVADAAPIQNSALIQLAAPAVYQQAMGISSDPITLPPDPVQQQPTYDAALAEFEKAPPVRVLFDNGAGASPTGTQSPGDPYPAYEKSFESLPVPGTKATSWYLGGGSALSAKAPTRPSVDRYTSDPRALAGNDFTGSTSGGGLWGNAAQWSWDWQQRAHGTAVSYVSPELTEDLTTVGAGAVHLWVRSSARDVDFQATVSEVRDGKETFVQSGWLRGSERKLATTADNIMKQQPSLLQPIPTFRAADVRPLPAHRWTKVVIPLYYQGHAYRKGSQIRVTISAPGGEQPIWSFAEARPQGRAATVQVASSRRHPSRLILPVVPGVTIDSEAPPCPSLRNQPCRDYVPFENQPGRG